MQQNIFEGFRPNETSEGSYKREDTFMLFVWKEFFMSKKFESASENTHWCEESTCALSVKRL